INYFQASPLARARFNLIQDIVIGLTTSLLIENFPELERERQFSALTAVSKMSVQKTGKILNDKLSGIIINKVDDDNWDKVIIYLAKITVWESLSEPCKLKAQNFVKKLEVYGGNNSFLSGVDRLSPNLKILIKAAHIDFLRDYVIKKFDKIPVKDILSLHDICGDNLFQTKIILPSLIKSAPEASLNELFLIRIKTPLVFDETILSCIKEKAKFSSLNDLADIMSNYDYELWQDLIRDLLEEKIINADFDELLSAKSKYKSSGKSKPEIIELFDNCINEKILEVDFDVLLKSSTYWCEIEAEKLILYLKNPLPEKVDFLELLLAKSKYHSSGKSKPEIIELFNSYINERISEIYWDDFLGFSRYWCEIDRENLVLIFQNFVPKKVNFLELLSAKLKYNLLEYSVPEIIEIFDNCIAEKIKEVSLNDVLTYNVHHRKAIPEKLLISILKTDISAIINKFANSSNYKEAGDNTQLLIIVAEELNNELWENVLTAFFENNQICNSWDCLADFPKLFKKSLELNNNSVQPYWLPFREKLGSGNQNFKQLKQLIDLYLTPEQKNQLNN
ncbi:MAG: hypothetical protein F6K34_02435, partial [Okeania sp. SIO4D6]|nr:hypothetical protein [Okeania sp. SIO4D6]